MAQYTSFTPVLEALGGNLKLSVSGPVQQISMRPIFPTIADAIRFGHRMVAAICHRKMTSMARWPVRTVQYTIATKRLPPKRDDACPSARAAACRRPLK